MSDPQTPPPAAGAVLPQWAVVALTALVGVAGVVMAVGQSGVQMPPWLTAVAGSVVGIGTMFGIMSPGVRRLAPSPPPSNVATLEQAAAELRKGPPAP